MENTDSMMQIRQVIEALEQKINTARRVPMTGYSMIDGGALLDLIGQMRIALPKAVVQAQDVLDQEEEILTNARNEADKTADRDLRRYRRQGQRYPRPDPSGSGRVRQGHPRSCPQGERGHDRRCADPR